MTRTCHTNEVKHTKKSFYFYFLWKAHSRCIRLSRSGPWRPPYSSAVPVTQSYVWHDSFICTTRLDCMCDRAVETPLQQRYAWDTAPWLIHNMWQDSLFMWHDSCTCVTGPWRPPYRGPVPKTRQNDLILCVPWLVHTCGMPHSHVRHASFTCVTCRILSHLLQMCNMVRLIHMCGITSYVKPFRTNAFRSCQFARDQFRTEYILTLINQNNRHALTLLVAVTYTYACSQASVCESQASVCARFLGRGRECYTRLQPCIWARLISRNATYKMSHVTNVDESCHTYESVSSHTGMLCFARTTCIASHHAMYTQVPLNIWKSHVSYVNESCKIHEWIISHESITNLTQHHLQCVMPRMCMSHVRYMHG